MAFFASNFIYLTESDLDALFPTDCRKPPYDGRYDAKVKAADYFSPTVFTAPYNLGDCGDCEGLGYDAKNWLMSSIRFSYVGGRRVIKGLLSIIRDNAKGKDALPFFLSFLVVPLIVFGSQFGGFFLTMLGEFYDGKNFLSRFLWGLFFMVFFAFGPMLAGGVAMVQVIQTIITFGLLPFFQNKMKLWGIFKRNNKLTMALFGYLVLRNASTTLPGLPQWPMWLVYLFLIVVPVLFGEARRRFAKSSA
jgi:hypothetical protein